MDSKQVLNRVTQQLKQASADSVTPAGQNNAPSDDQLSAINQIFELFRFNYHNQFLKAFPDLDTMNMAKRLWLRLLGDYSGEVIMRAAEKAVKENYTVPNTHTLGECKERTNMADNDLDDFCVVEWIFDLTPKKSKQPVKKTTRKSTAPRKK